SLHVPGRSAQPDHAESAAPLACANNEQSRFSAASWSCRPGAISSRPLRGVLGHMSHPLAVRRVLLQPEAGGRLSGGYLYNRRMAEHSPASRPLALTSISADGAAAAMAGLGLGAGDLVLADSLFLLPDRLGPFLALQHRRVRVGMLIH